MKQWYVIYANRAFRGVDKPAFIYEKDLFFAYERYKTIKGVRKHTNPNMRMPDISALTTEQAARLERLIRKEGKIPMMQAKGTWYYPDLEGLAYLNFIPGPNY